MPTYIVKRESEKDNPDAKTWEVMCSYTELQEMCLEYDLMQVPSAPKIVTGVGNLHAKVPDGFRDLMKNRIKKGSAKNNTVKV